MASVLLQLLLVSLASARRHFGGSVTFSVKDKNPDGSFRVEVRHMATFDSCQDSYTTFCWHNCGLTSTWVSGKIDSSTNAPQSNTQWCQIETVDTRNVPSDKHFELRYLGCCWTQTRHGLNNDWRLQSSLDLGSRSDTGKPNRSPDIAILPFLRVPENCSRTYELMSFDPDGDRVRCRYGNIPNVECSSCHQPSGFTLDQDSCTLHYNQSTTDPRVYGFELVVEDFPQRNITLGYTDGSRSSRTPLVVRSKRHAAHTTLHGPTPPLSKLPLQFSFLVDPLAPSCQEGLYLPEFLPPTPLNGARLHAEVDREVEIRVRARASHATIHDIIISGPLNITKQRSTHGEFVIRWTPIQDDLGDFFPICFAVEAETGRHDGTATTHHHNHNHHSTPSPQSSVYQSEMRCVLVEVRRVQVNSHVICTESTMRVEVEKSSFHGLHEDHLRLNDGANIACRLHSNSTYVFADIPLSGCGTELEEDGDNLRFKNEITTFDNRTDVITRKHLLEVQFYCQYPKRGNATLAFTVHRPIVSVWDRGFGRFTYQFEFYANDQYQAMVDPTSYPVVYEIGSRVYKQIEATSSVNNTVLFVESCRASPYDNQNSQQTYSIIENGCKVDPTVQIHSPSHPRQFRFSMKAFKFIGMFDQVYISCTVLMCAAGEPNTRSSQGCISSTTPATSPHDHHRRKREVRVESARHFVSQGPLRLKRSAESSESSALHLNLNLVFIAGCLLAAVGMISAVVLYKARMSKVKYQPLSTDER
ncbi:uncharacterized protein LOC142934294 [Anarhichas minor]|uniref:uncharacterized protein LOC142934294 n=1 Tax=Anarhichas minor TaxID=65739 RepID=UPI003F735C97